jgi:DNA modification methylase
VFISPATGSGKEVAAMAAALQPPQIEVWQVSRLVFYAGNPRKNDAAVDRMVASIREFGFKIPVLARSGGEVVDGHLRLKAAKKLGITEVPVILCDEWTEAQVKAFRLMVNRSVGWAEWDEELLAQELTDLKGLDFDLSLTGFDDREIDDFLAEPDDGRADLVPPLPEHPATRLGDVWLLGNHRLFCGDCTQADVVAKLLGGAKPLLLVTDPPYGISLDTEWRDRAGLNSAPGQKRTAASKAAAKTSPQYPAAPSYMKHRTEGHTETTISGDTIADWSHAFELVPSLQVAYVWHASVHTVEVVNGLLRIGFLYPQQIIWNKGRPVLTRTHYLFAHEPAWYVRKKNAPWFGTVGSENSTVWEAKSPKFIMGGSKEVGDNKQDHPTQKPVELMRKPILNHTRRGAVVYDPFLGSGTTLIAAEMSERACYGMEIDPKFADVIAQRWQEFAGGTATLEADGRSFAEVKAERLGVPA